MPPVPSSGRPNTASGADLPARSAGKACRSIPPSRCRHSFDRQASGDAHRCPRLFRPVRDRARHLFGEGKTVVAAKRTSRRRLSGQSSIRAATRGRSESTTSPALSRCVSLVWDHRWQLDFWSRQPLVRRGSRTEGRSYIRAIEHIATRLRHTRRALGVNQTEFARRVNLKPNRYSQYESAARPLTIDAALSICEEYGLTLDWLFRGDRSMLPHHLALEIARIEAAER
jgi:DNA-binding XRE family transcriptional regulator